MKLKFHIFTSLFLLPILFTIFSIIYSTPAYAQCAAVPPNTPTDQVINLLNQCAIQVNEFDDKVFNLNQTIGLINSLNGMINGATPATPKLSQILQNQSALASASTLIAATYTPPASGIAYFAGKFQQLNPVKPVYAQGIGYTALNPVQPVWTNFRNISYVGFVFIFILIGFMIMFRAKVSPQTVATVQDSIPRIIIALIFVTFSYAIVGLIIDFMVLLINIVILVLSPGLIDAGTANNIIFNRNIFHILGSAMPEIGWSTSAEVTRLIFNVFGTVGGALVHVLTFGQLGNIGGLIVGIAVLFIMFRIFWMLLTSYISIIILTIFAPFILLFQALPGNNGAMGWLKQLLANILVFPVVALMILLAGIFSGIGALGGGTVAPINQGNLTAFPLLIGGIDVNVVGFMIGLGFLFMTPMAANLIKERLKTGQGLGFGGAGAAALGASAGLTGRMVSTSPAARAFTDLSEERGRRQAASIIARAPGWAGGPGATTNQAAREISRGRVRQG